MGDSRHAQAELPEHCTAAERRHRPWIDHRGFEDDDDHPYPGSKTRSPCKFISTRTAAARVSGEAGAGSPGCRDGPIVDHLTGAGAALLELSSGQTASGGEWLDAGAPVSRSGSGSSVRSVFTRGFPRRYRSTDRTIECIPVINRVQHDRSGCPARSPDRTRPILEGRGRIDPRCPQSLTHPMRWPSAPAQGAAVERRTRTSPFIRSRRREQSPPHAARTSAPAPRSAPRGRAAGRSEP